MAEVASAGYHLAFSDEFNAPELDAAKWDYRTGSNFFSTQLPANVSVADGSLKIQLKKESAGNQAYTGGGVISRSLFKYGYYEARIKVPASSGWHTSFWTKSQHRIEGGKQEIDICEQTSVKPDYSVGVIDWNFPKGKSAGRLYPPAPDLHQNFHVWSCKFTPALVKFYFDGQPVYQIDATTFAHSQQNIWLTAIANTKVDDSKLPAVAEFDYVRFYAPPDSAAK